MSALWLQWNVLQIIQIPVAKMKRSIDEIVLLHQTLCTHRAIRGYNVIFALP